MDKILISACLIGDKTRYDGGDNRWPFAEKLMAKYDLVPFCPEVEGGLPVPREPAEIKRNQVFTKSGKDVTKEFDRGAERALQACRLFGIRIAILKDDSPSCGCRHIHDGHFTGTKIDGLGVTARLLIANGVKVYAETDDLAFLLGEVPAAEKSAAGQLPRTEGRYVSFRPRPKEEGRPFGGAHGTDGRPFRTKEGKHFGKGYAHSETHEGREKVSKPGSFGRPKTFDPAKKGTHEGKKAFGSPKKTFGTPKKGFGRGEGSFGGGKSHARPEGKGSGHGFSGYRPKGHGGFRHGQKGSKYGKDGK